MATEANQRLSKNERRQQAREQARKAREREKRREKRRRLYWQGGIVLGAIAVLAVAGLIAMQVMKPAGPGPRNMASGGVVWGADLEVQETPALQEGEERQAPQVDREQLPIDVTVYADYMCPGCGAFEQSQGTMLQNYVGSGDITLQMYPINFQDGQSLGTNYSTRAANIVSCVVDQQPEFAFNLHNRLLSANVQPAQGTPGLTDEELLDQAEQAGATIDDELESCVDDQRFGEFISQNTKVATEVGVLGLEPGAQLLGGGELQPADGPQRLAGTPLVIVNGEEWVEQRDGGLEEHLLKVKAEIEQNGGGADDAEEDAEEGE